MSMMKTSLTITPMCPRERFALYKSPSRLVLCYKKVWATLQHLSYLLPITNYLTTQLSVTDNYMLGLIIPISNSFEFKHDDMMLADAIIYKHNSRDVTPYKKPYLFSYFYM